MMRALAAANYRLCLAVLVGLFLVLVAGTFGLSTWPFELLNHFALQYLIAAVFLCLVFLMGGKKAPAAAAFVFALVFATDYQQAPKTQDDMASSSIGAAAASVLARPGLPSRRLSLMTHNVSDMNRRSEDVLTWLATRPADIIALVEVPAGMSGAFADLKEVYRHQFVIEPGDRLNSEVYAGRETLAILSVHPIAAKGVVRPSGQGKLSLLAKIAVPGASDPWIVVVHPANPTRPARLAARDSYLLDLAGLIAGIDGPVIVAGDFNVTPYAPAFRQFLRASRTSTARGFPATWPSMLGPMGIPIDHVLVREARLADLEAFSSPGSDHRVLKAEILLSESPERHLYAARP